VTLNFDAITPPRGDPSALSLFSARCPLAGYCSPQEIAAAWLSVLACATVVRLSVTTTAGCYRWDAEAAASPSGQAALSLIGCQWTALRLSVA
jgi:hypothetical protein